MLINGQVMGLMSLAINGKSCPETQGPLRLLIENLVEAVTKGSLWIEERGGA